MLNGTLSFLQKYFLMEMFLAPLPMVYTFLSLFVLLSRVCSNVDNFNKRNLFLTAKLLKQGYRYHKIRKELVAVLNVSPWCLVMVEWLFLAVPWGCLQFVIVVFPDHTHLLFLFLLLSFQFCIIYGTCSQKYTGNF